MKPRPSYIKIPTAIIDCRSTHQNINANFITTRIELLVNNVEKIYEVNYLTAISTLTFTFRKLTII